MYKIAAKDSQITFQLISSVLLIICRHVCGLDVVNLLVLVFVLSLSIGGGAVQ